jgi:phosphoribosylformylglycinamidine synthase PurS subunit
MLKAEIYVTLKKTVSDPQGLTIKHALASLNFKEVEEVRIGKLIAMKLNLKNKKEAQRKLEEMCKKLLANPVIEDYSFQIIEDTT